ncbi:MAG TPA: hypothetical protein VGM92_14125 [Candidatus Kapabacteria bacterium]|jgi:hypothetical protein
MKKFHPYLSIRCLAILAGIALSFAFNSCGAPAISASYTAPDWAPAYSDASSVPYYYFPDYDMYYDVGAGQYYYLNNGAWAASAAVPYSGVDLGSSYTVLLGRGTTHPWDRDDYYRRNYPAHAHEQYGPIVTNNHVITNVPDGHVVMPRAFNENTNRVTFDERARAANGTQRRVATHEVPMERIAPNMPAQSRSYRYGGAVRGR